MPAESLLGACTATAPTEVSQSKFRNGSDCSVGAAWASRIQDALTKHQLKNNFYGTATFAVIKAAVDQGQSHLVLLGPEIDFVQVTWSFFPLN